MLKYILILLFVLAYAPPAQAQLTITLVDDLQFGNLITRNPAAIGRVTVDADGSFSNNADILVVSLGQRSRWSLTGGPASTAYTVTIDSNTNVTRTLGGTTGEFTLDNFTIFPAVLSTNGSGADTFFIGARANTQGGGTDYLDGAYDGTYDFTVAF